MIKTFFVLFAVSGGFSSFEEGYKYVRVFDTMEICQAELQAKNLKEEVSSSKYGNNFYLKYRSGSFACKAVTVEY